jgi:hypothetical protein
MLNGLHVSPTLFCIYSMFPGDDSCITIENTNRIGNNSKSPIIDPIISTTRLMTLLIADTLIGG